MYHSFLIHKKTPKINKIKYSTYIKTILLWLIPTVYTNQVVQCMDHYYRKYLKTGRNFLEEHMVFVTILIFLLWAISYCVFLD